MKLIFAAVAAATVAGAVLAQPVQAACRSDAWGWHCSPPYSHQGSWWWRHHHWHSDYR